MAGVPCDSMCAVVVSYVRQFFKRSRTSLAYLSILIPGLVFAQAQMSTRGSFSVSPGGAANYTIPIQISPGTGGINHDANDRYCLDGQRLIVVNGLANDANNAEYRTERETLIVFTRFGYVVANRVGGESKVDPARSCIQCR